ncbi:MAG: Ig-like domain-containing protein [Allosphingosinicella sp.]
MANLSPEIDLNGGAPGNSAAIAYAENDPLTPIAPDATVSDPDSPDFDQGSLTVAFTSGGTADDQLRVLGGDFSVEETDLYYQGLAIGTITGGTDGSTPLVVTFNADSTPAIAAALVRAIGFVNFSESPVAGQRVVTFTLTDGDGGASTPRTATIDVEGGDTPPLAQDDAISTSEDAVATGSLFADNGNGGDSDPDGPALTVSEVNGSAGNVGVPILLASGARLTVLADGSYSYDPNGQFDYLVESGTGAVNPSSAVDSFTYGLAGGNVATVTVTVNGVASPGDRLEGDEEDNFITGTPSPDGFVLDQGGSDTVSGLAGDDYFYFGGALTADDNVDGGNGTDTIVLQGDYGGGLVLDGSVTGIEGISMLAGTNTNFGEPGTNLYDYFLTISDSNFAAGLRARINGSSLLAGEDLTFDGSAETDSSFLVYGGYGTDRLTGGAGNDIFFFDIGRFAAGDAATGGAGYDGLFLRGDYALDFTARGFGGALNGIENITLTSATDTRYARGGDSEFDYNLILSNEAVGEGQALTVSGALLTAGETMTVDGSRESDGTLRLFGGASNDTLIGGAQGDLILGGLGGDEISGGGGADSFRYQAAAESVNGSADHILDFTPGTDRIELDRIDADSLTAGDQAFTWIGSDAFSGTAGELRAYDSGPVWLVEGDIDGDGLADFVISLTLLGQTPLGAGDFVL